MQDLRRSGDHGRSDFRQYTQLSSGRRRVLCVAVIGGRGIQDRAERRDAVLMVIGATLAATGGGSSSGSGHLQMLLLLLNLLLLLVLLLLVLLLRLLQLLPELVVS